jgi:drug/metabolite transporter (DMT)-like permease
MSLYFVILVSASAAILTYLILGLATHNFVFDIRDVGAGLSGGFLNLLGTILLLKALATGRMGVVSGVGRSYILIPIAYSLVIGESLGVLPAIGMVVIVLGIALFCLPGWRKAGGSDDSLRPIFLALGTAVLYGLAVVVLDIGSRANIYGTLTLAQCPHVVVTSVIVLTARRYRGTGPRDIGILIGSGLALGLANLAFYAAAVEGNVGIVSVLRSMSPIVTALLAFFILKEALRRTEILALIVVLIGTGMVLA